MNLDKSICKDCAQRYTCMFNANTIRKECELYVHEQCVLDMADAYVRDHMLISFVLEDLPTLKGFHGGDRIEELYLRWRNFLKANDNIIKNIEEDTNG